MIEKGTERKGIDRKGLTEYESGKNADALQYKYTEVNCKNMYYSTSKSSAQGNKETVNGAKEKSLEKDPSYLTKQIDNKHMGWHPLLVWTDRWWIGQEKMHE